MNNIKQVIVWRKDIQVRLGKKMAQSAHASMKVFFDRMWKPKWESIENCDLCMYEVDCKLQNWSSRTKEEDKDVYPNSDPCKAYRTNVYYTNYTSSMELWKEGSFTKIVVGCNSEEELHLLKQQADDAGIVNAIILDNGNTEFKEICSTCNGDGLSRVLRETVKNVKEVYCETCGGYGKVNKPTYTCLAIGPDEAEKIDKITGSLKLL